MALPVLLLLFGPGLAVVGPGGTEQLRMVAHRPIAGHDGEQQGRGAGERLGLDVAGDRGQQGLRRLGGLGARGLGELHDVFGDVGVDL
jgi:hypothetical protein